MANDELTMEETNVNSNTLIEKDTNEIEKCANEDSTVVSNGVTNEENGNVEQESLMENHWGFSLFELYKIALRFYKGKFYLYTLFIDL